MRGHISSVSQCLETPVKHSHSFFIYYMKAPGSERVNDMALLEHCLQTSVHQINTISLLYFC